MNIGYSVGVLDKRMQYVIYETANEGEIKALLN